jgi:hypothetical protein
VRRAAKTDANQTAVVDHLRAAGWGVHITSAVGGGFPDLVCARGRFTALVELKDGSKGRWETRLDEAQALFDAYWPGVVVYARSAQEAEMQLTEAMAGART